MGDDDITARSRAELREDLRALLARVHTQRDRLDALRLSMLANAPHLPAGALDASLPFLAPVDASHADLEKRLLQSLRSNDGPQELARLKQRAVHELRSLLALDGALAVACNWQSPSYAHARWSQAGTQTGRVTGTKNDYLRDHHAWADAYESAFVEAYVDRPAGERVRAYATSSGMAAFAMAATRLAGEDGACALVGGSGWFQNKCLLDRLFRGRLHEIDELDTRAIADAVTRLAPSAVFIDTLCNTESLPVPDLAELLPAIDAAAKRPVTLVLDNSGLAATCQPLQAMPLRPRRLKLMVCEGLNKYHQFGADRATAGILWTAGGEVDDLFYVRMSLGANITDVNAHVLPAPDRTLHDARMGRIGRNARWLARRLQNHVDAGGHRAYARVVHPSLPQHPAHERMANRPFAGGNLTLVPHGAWRCIEAYQHFIEAALAEARDAGVDLVAGAGFGFDTTRVYLTSLFAGPHTRPFLRISAGTESLAELHALGDVLVRAMDRVAEERPEDYAHDQASSALLQLRSLRRDPLGKWASATVVR